ncbi:hypothetical protein AS026_31705 [Rhizobium altiplani]|uniref:Uncharacterized protein n=1 Tax=Rhizobium altiplani TaxID=1864509 RepID=A0A120FPM4_9HYPH|nr:hypothetical protein AS026_31705 [Rhizobium altiplani]
MKRQLEREELADAGLLLHKASFENPEQTIPGLSWRSFVSLVCRQGSDQNPIEISSADTIGIELCSGVTSYHPANGCGYRSTQPRWSSNNTYEAFRASITVIAASSGSARSANRIDSSSPR